MNQLTHLTDHQIEEYVRDNCGDGPAAQNEQIEAHLLNCGSCRGRVLETERIHLGVLHHSPGNKTRYPGCPDEEVLAKLVAGVCPQETASQITQHATECDFCGPRLKQYLEDYSDQEPAPERNPSHMSPSTFWSRLRKKFSGPSNFSLHRVAWAGGLAAAIVLAVIGGPAIITSFQISKVSNLAAAAFVEKRPSEMRPTWAPYAEYDIKLATRTDHDRFRDHPKLIEAENAAMDKRNSLDPRWLRINGRIALLNGEADAADLLKKATEKGLDDPSTEIDLAIAYFQKDTQSTDKKAPPNLDETINLLNKVLKEPQLTRDERAVALFDLAIAYEKMLFWDQSVLVWDQYLVLDSASRWADEARQHRSNAQQKIQHPPQQGYKEPTFFLRHLSDPETQARIEQYQDVALRTWLPDALQNHAAESLQAAQTVADLLAQHHGDPWMKDFLGALRPGDLPAVLALGAAITSNRQGLNTNAERQAQIAAAIFVHRKNVPGTLRARFESVYANQRLLEETRCLTQADELEKDLRRTSYRWLQAQIALEHAACINFEGKYEAADTNLAAAAKNVETHHFPWLNLRVMGLNAGMKVSRDCNETWQHVATGLGQYWEGPSFPGRLYEFYSVTKQCLEKKKKWHAAEALEERIITILKQEIDHDDENVVLEVTAQQALGHILKELHEDGPAEEQERQALVLLKRIPAEEPAAQKYELPIKLELAELQLGRGDSGSALATLESARQRFSSTHYGLIRLNFYRVLGDVHLKLAQLDIAETDYKTGLEIAEEALGTLKKESMRLQWTKETGEIYRGLVGVFLGQKKDKEALQLWEWYQARSLTPQTSPGSGPVKTAWQEIEKEVSKVPLPTLPSGTRLIYASIKDRLNIWAIGRERTRTFLVPAKRQDLERMVHEFAEKCSNPDSDMTALEEQSKDLFSLLLQPMVPELRESETVVVELDQSMNGLPLEALKGPENWYFGQKYPVIYSPGFIGENHLRPPFWRVASGTVLLVDASTSNGIGDLDTDKSEQDAIIRFAPQAKVISSVDALAGLRAALINAEIFSFIGHGNGDALITGPGASLNAGDFPPEALKNLRLAVFAACSTGSAKDGLFDTNSLVHAFLVGGVSNVIASHWDVSSKSTAQLMTSFYTHLKKDSTVAYSMYEARKDVFRTHRHPYYWAAFSVSGRLG